MFTNAKQKNERQTLNDEQTTNNQSAKSRLYAGWLDVADTAQQLASTKWWRE